MNLYLIVNVEKMIPSPISGTSRFTMGVDCFDLALSSPSVTPVILSRIYLIQFCDIFLLFGLVNSNGSDMPFDEAVKYAIAMTTLVAINGICSNHFHMNGVYNAMKMRVAICNLIYKKSLRLSQTALHDTSPGKLVNLLSNDVSRFDLFTSLMSPCWGAPLITIIGGILLWKETGWAGLMGLIIVFIIAPLMSE